MSGNVTYYVTLTFYNGNGFLFADQALVEAANVQHLANANEALLWKRQALQATCGCQLFIQRDELAVALPATSTLHHTSMLAKEQLGNSCATSLLSELKVSAKELHQPLLLTIDHPDGVPNLAWRRLVATLESHQGNCCENWLEIRCGNGKRSTYLLVYKTQRCPKGIIDFLMDKDGPTYPRWLKRKCIPCWSRDAGVDKLASHNIQKLLLECSTYHRLLCIRAASGFSTSQYKQSFY